MMVYCITYDNNLLSFESLFGEKIKMSNALKARAGEHDELQFNSFSNTKAFEIGLRLVEVARMNGYQVAIDIRKHGQQVFHYACEGTSRDNDEWIVRKNKVTDYFGKSSIYIKEMIKDAGKTQEELFFIDSMEFSSFGGAFPIIIRDTGAIGTVTVSGLPDEQDHELVVSVLREFVETDGE